MSTDSLNAHALITIEEGRRYVWRNEDDTSRDGILVDAINDVSDSIWDHCHREFKPTTVDDPEERVFDYDGSGWLDLNPFDLQELDSVVLYTDRDAAFQVELDAKNYRLRPTGRARGGTYLAVELPIPAMREFDYGFEWQVTVTGTWGMLEVPGAVKLACKQWVDNLVKNPGSYAANSMSGYTVVPEQDFTAHRAGMPPSVQHRLAPWCRQTKRSLEVIRFAHTDRDAPAIPHRLPTI
jgi:hypothetical protein